jgi:hypothetical protein
MHNYLYSISTVLSIINNWVEKANRSVAWFISKQCAVLYKGLSIVAVDHEPSHPQTLKNEGLHTLLCKCSVWQFHSENLKARRENLNSLIESNMLFDYHLCILCFLEEKPSISFFFFLRFFYLFIICKYTVAVFRHSRRGRQISLQMVVSHHVVAGIWTPDLRKSSRVLLPTEPSLQPHPFLKLDDGKT